MIQEAIHKVINRQDLTYEEAVEVMGEIMSGEASQIQMATFLTALRMKGETIEEITACAQGMRNAGAHHCTKLRGCRNCGNRWRRGRNL